MTETNSPSRVRAILAVIAVLAVGGLAGSFMLRLAPSATDFTMPVVEADVAQRFPMLARLSIDDLSAKLASTKPPLLVDVRDDAEFRVSHIAGAEHIDPESTIAAVNARLAPLAAGREVVLYCSVGMRSSVIATEVQEDLVKAGAVGVYNLRGGIFAWHNASRPLVNDAGPTNAIHPYNAQWGKLLTRQDQVRLLLAP
ncbi:MAG: rhodanese-like domain-containing protein [Hyphomicrobium sp.]